MAKDSIQIQLAEVLDKFAEQEREVVQDCVMKAGKQAKRIVKAKSPGGKYAEGWKVRNIRRSHVVETIVYNADEPSLTHLLEKSHVIKNKYGTYGRTGPGHGQVVHIAPAQKEAEEYLMDLLKSKL